MQFSILYTVIEIHYEYKYFVFAFEMLLQKVYASMIKRKPLIGMTHRQSVKAVGFGFIVKGQG